MTRNTRVSVSDVELALRRENDSSSLQELSDSFYDDVAVLHSELVSERDAAVASSANPYDDRDVLRLSDRIDRLESTVNRLVNARVGKLIQSASLSAAGMLESGGCEGATPREEELFDALVCVLSDARSDLLVGGVSDDADDTTN